MYFYEDADPIWSMYYLYKIVKDKNIITNKMQNINKSMTLLTRINNAISFYA